MGQQETTNFDQKFWRQPKKPQGWKRTTRIGNESTIFLGFQVCLASTPLSGELYTTLYCWSLQTASRLFVCLHQTSEKFIKETMTLIQHSFGSFVFCCTQLFVWTSFWFFLCCAEHGSISAQHSEAMTQQHKSTDSNKDLFLCHKTLQKTTLYPFSGKSGLFWLLSSVQQESELISLFSPGAKSSSIPAQKNTELVQYNIRAKEKFPAREPTCNQRTKEQLQLKHDDLGNQLGSKGRV